MKIPLRAFLAPTIALGCVLLSGSSKGADKFSVGASLLTSQHPFYVLLANAMKEEAVKDGVDLNLTIANQDLSKQLSDIEDFITKGVNVIIISPVDSKGVRGAVLKAQKAGIPVITVDIAATGTDVTSHVATDNYGGGVKAGELMGKVLDGKGKVGVIDYPMAQSTIDRVAGFKKAIAAFPGIQIATIQPGLTRAEALTAAQNMLQAHSDLSGIFAYGDDAALAALAAVKSAHAEDHVKIIGFDGMEEARNAVDKNPCFVGVIRQYPEKMGAEAVDTAVKVLKHEQVPKLQPIDPGIYTNENKEGAKQS
jgi:ribose transport system substrate-binding protein